MHGMAERIYNLSKTGSLDSSETKERILRLRTNWQDAACLRDIPSYSIGEQVIRLYLGDHSGRWLLIIP